MRVRALFYWPPFWMLNVICAIYGENLLPVFHFVLIAGQESLGSKRSPFSEFLEF